MFNLLPDSLKDQIKSDYKLRRLTVFLIILISVQTIVFILLVPSWLISYYKENALIFRLEKTSHSELSYDANEIKNKIKVINNEVNLLNTALEYPKLSPLIDYILTKRNPSIKLESFTYNGGKTWTLTVQGISATRESLVAMVDNLKQSGLFKNVDLPVSNLAKNKNIDFSITMTIPK